MPDVWVDGKYGPWVRACTQAFGCQSIDLRRLRELQVGHGRVVHPHQSCEVRVQGLELVGGDPFQRELIERVRQGARKTGFVGYLGKATQRTALGGFCHDARAQGHARQGWGHRQVGANQGRLCEALGQPEQGGGLPAKQASGRAGMRAQWCHPCGTVGRDQ